MKALLKLKEVKHPISDTTIGFRIQAAIPNEAGWKGKPSFRSPFFIAETGDYTESHLVQGDNFARVLSDFERQIEWQGFTDSVFTGQ